MTLVKERAPITPTREQRAPMSYAQFLTDFQETDHIEWVNGEAIIFMPPTSLHQAFAGFLYALLSNFVRFFELGQLFFAPYEMKVSPNSSGREPDILFVARTNLARITEKKLEGPADLIIEVISTESAIRDRNEKFLEYEAAGVREYWLFDPRPYRQRADFWVLDSAGRYQLIPVGVDGIYHSTILPHFWLNINWLWREPLPDPLSTFAQIVGPDKLIAFLQRLQDQ
jgi:Uma2 family endonuclease